MFRLIGCCLLMTAVATGQTAFQKTETGTVCVSAVPKPNADPLSLGNPAGGDRTFNYKVQIGSQNITASTQRSVALKGLVLNKKHFVKILRDDKTVESFHFSFAKAGSAHLCLWYKSLYETWTLSPAKGARDKCNC